MNYFSLMVKKRLADNKDDIEEGEHSDMDKRSKIASRTANLVRKNNIIPFLTLSIKSGKSQYYSFKIFLHF